MFLTLLLLAVFAIIAAAIAGFFYLPLLPAIAMAVVGAPILILLVVTVFGLYKRAQPLRPFNAAEQQREAVKFGGEGRHVTLPDGRSMEYLVYGSQQPDAKVIVQLHGQGSCAAYPCEVNAPLCEQLNLKGIAPSYPGAGYSDIHAGRQIVDFPRDVEAILEAEGVGEFMVEGMSLGTPHAMAVAKYFGPDRCVALGLNVPYLPEPVCREFNFRHDADYLPKGESDKWYGAWKFVIAEILFKAPLIGPPARHMGKLLEGARTQADRPWVFKTLAADERRTVIRGTQGMGWEFFSYDVLALWGFDPREVDTKNVAVWYALDDSQSPPEHGKWLAEVFSSREDVRTNIRVEEAGFGHFTYTPSLGPTFQASEQTIVHALLELCDRQPFPP